MREQPVLVSIDVGALVFFLTGGPPLRENAQPTAVLVLFCRFPCAIRVTTPNLTVKVFVFPICIFVFAFLGKILSTSGNARPQQNTNYKC